MKNRRTNPHLPKLKPSAVFGAILLALLTAGTVLFAALSSRNAPDPLPSLAPDAPAEGVSRAILPDEPDTSPGEVSPVSAEPDPVQADPVQADPVQSETVDWAGRLAELAASLPADPSCPIGDLTSCLSSIDPALAEAVIREDPQTAAAFRAAFRRFFGVTPLAYQMQPGVQNPSGEGSLVFTGDINFADDWYSMEAYRALGSDITKNIPDPLLGILRDADLCVMNCEFSMSLRGAPLEGKYYTFRADPAHAALFQTLGCDLVTLANNHVYDYGRDAFLDTLDTLDAAGIARIGAGRTLDEAKAYRAFVIGGAKIGFVAASNAEIYRMTPGATAEEPGILLMYDPAEFCDALDRARAECDFVCALVHWGTENSTEINDNQREYAALFASHGAGLIVGHHPHVLQPVETTAGIPVAYSLGNFWFNLVTLDTGVLWVDLGWDDLRGVIPEVTFIPCIQENGVTNVAEP